MLTLIDGVTMAMANNPVVIDTFYETKYQLLFCVIRL